MQSLATIPSRLERLLGGLRARGCDRALLIGQSHAAHLLAYQRIWSGPLALVVGVDGELTLLAPVYEVEAARAECPQAVVRGYGEPGFGLDLASLDKLVAVAAATVGRGRLAVASDLAGLGEAIAQAAGADAVPVDDLVREVRLIKDADELRLIARSYALTLVGAAAVEAGSQPGASEIELYSAAQHAAQVAAGAVVEFGADLLVGARSAHVCGPVAVPGRTAAAAGDVVLADIAVRHRGYWGDTARTFVAGDNDDAWAARDAMREILAAAGEQLRPGVRACDVYADMASAIAARYPGAAFPHHGGHGLGVSVFEDPHLIPADATELAEGMVVAVEPGVYLEGRFGAREENLYVVTADGGLELDNAFGGDR